ncbi:hypothetical protein GCM10009716_29700 [Streptomyces sodiiphilus]|uniref:Cytochrome bc1 complex Rieske iron-sulfur subunit n=1 Tax=Streptomyces sodiiphilus TaxID=226217 RepID=A0ABN2PEG3_9ACTN
MRNVAQHDTSPRSACPGPAASAPSAGPPASSRRAVLLAAALAPAGAAALTGCERRDPAKPDLPDKPLDLGSPDAVPVGGARLYPVQRVLVSQPSEGDFRAFSAVCTHGGCVLSRLRELTGDCGCHGSRFDLATGQVLQGPATDPLPPLAVGTDDGALTAGPAA